MFTLRPDNTDTAPVGAVEHFGVGTFSQDGVSSAFNIVEEFSGEEHERYTDALDSVLGLGERFTVSLVERNFRTYLDQQKFAATLIDLGRAFGSPDQRALAEALMGQIINWLTSFRLFLDHAQTRLKRQFGNDSPQAQLFERRTYEAFDRHLGYRFIWKFRNYVQHCGAPMSSLEVGRRESTHVNPYIRQQASFRLSRTQLLSTFD